MSIRIHILPLFYVFFLFISVSIHNALHAQLTPYYKFTSSNGTYTTITGGALIDTGNSIGNQRYTVTLPFTFMMDDSLYTQAMISANGFLSLGTGDPGAGNYAPIANSPSGYTVISAFGRDLNSLNNTTAIRAQTFGTAPYRKYIIQWSNFSYGTSSGITINFQIALYETYNKIDVVYGSNTTSLNTITGQVGLRGSLINTNFFARSSSTGWSSTTAATVNTAVVTLSPSYTPSSGLTYTFELPDSCITPLTSATALSLTPNYTSISGSFTGLGTGTRYLIVRTPGSAALGTLPINGSRYAVGGSIGNGTVIYRGPLTSFSNTGLPQNSTYTYTIFPYFRQRMLLWTNVPNYISTLRYGADLRTETLRLDACEWKRQLYDCRQLESATNKCRSGRYTDF